MDRDIAANAETCTAAAVCFRTLFFGTLFFGTSIVTGRPRTSSLQILWLRGIGLRHIDKIVWHPEFL
jgi:hypothetical protein